MTGRKSQNTTSKINKYVIHSARWPDGQGGSRHVWWARVPYGHWQRFDSWSDAAGYLQLRHKLRADDKPTWTRR